ncbi:DUF6286 domain-containing protein [Streptomyces coelicoflavus]|uniref:DUF6286 domain-containing Asp23/Gls24 family envelope stress response protein n=1 Tax=Streptomyces coelicoflavus TaxID=285562 RepID=UPI0024AD07AA|nr:DUF6286 domain-containing protein [Streptomyces coelicoflavus]MDI6520610.1 DUF6286 domain-containing protein [Streptomyces coelicoflavus]
MTGTPDAGAAPGAGGAVAAASAAEGHVGAVPGAGGSAATPPVAGGLAGTAPAAGGSARTAAGGGRPARTAPAERGRTVVADRAVRRIAERAAAETDLAGRRARVTHGTATVHGRRADVSVDVRLPYPAVLGEAGERVRGRMADRVAELSGLTVRAATVRVHSLSPDRAAPQPPPAHEDAPSAGRTARRPWSARRAPAALVALVASAACAFLLYDVLSVHLAGRRPAGPRTEAVDWLATHGPGDTAVVAGGAVAAVLGAWLLCLALTPGLRGVLPMAPVPGRDGQRAVLDRAAAAELVRDAASAVPGVTHVRVRCGRRRVRVRARLAFGDRPTTRTALRTTTDATLTTLGLPRRLVPRITLRPDPHWRPPGAEPAAGESIAAGGDGGRGAGAGAGTGEGRSAGWDTVKERES